MTPAVGWLGDVTKCDSIELSSIATSSSIEWKQDGPRQSTPDSSNDDQHSEEPQEEERIE